MVTEMLSAGAILVGKASTHEIGIGTTGLNVVAGDLTNVYCLHNKAVCMSR